MLDSSSETSKSHRVYNISQHDSQEFLRTILDELHNELNRVESIPKFSYKEKDFDSLRFEI